MTVPTLAEINLYQIRLPLRTPYRLSYRTFEQFEPIIVTVRDDSGRCAFGEGHISPGSSDETRAGGWAFCQQQAKQILNLPVTDGLSLLDKAFPDSPVAATALISAIEMLAGHPLLQVREQTRLPLLTPFNGLTPDAIVEEVDTRLQQGFRTFKIKVGADVDSDLARVRAIQTAAAGRATLRIDANRAYSQADGCRFAAALDADGIELFEQPCAAADWDANAAVAKVSAVPLMLDEPICSLADIERTADIEGVGYCKLKLKRFGGLEKLCTALERVHELAMEAVLGDGLSSEPNCWMEACVARTTIRNAGEFNGFLKPRQRLFQNPLVFDNGELILEPGAPCLDMAQLDRLTIAHERLKS